MKILYLTPGCFDKGGISRYSRYQISALREIYGKENVIVYSLLGKDKDSIEEDIDVQWSGKGPDIRSKLLFSWRTFSKGISWKPDLIFCAHVNLSGLSCMTAKLCGAKTVLNVYGLEVRMKLSFDAAWGLKTSQRIISDCHSTADHLLSEKLKDASKVSVIWDCIALNKFKPGEVPDITILSKYNIPNPADHFIVLTLGRLTLPDALYKGYDRLLRVMARLFRTHEEAVLVIAGRGNYREELEKMAQRLNVSDKVRFTGSVDEADLPMIYRSCHLFSLITESGEGKGEGIPLTPLEAMACGKPILVGNQDGSKEAVFENLNGYIFEPNDLDAQQKIIEQLITDKMLLLKKSKAAANIAERHFSYENFKTKHEQFLKSWLNEHLS